ncbi:MAG: hypothetical protein HW421_3863 [Ignavibacteria bacterium]|nr:hypothetical protein [Ignavibacteria bacterium]
MALFYKLYIREKLPGFPEVFHLYKDSVVLSFSAFYCSKVNKNSNINKLFSFLLFLFLFLFCPNLKAQVYSDNQFKITSFDNNSKIFCNGMAYLSTGKLVLTESKPWKNGSAFRTDRVEVRDGFTTKFSFRLTEGNIGKKPTDDPNPGADGIAFAIQNQYINALGSMGWGIGYTLIENSLCVEFDTYLNSVGEIFNALDPNANHVSVQTKGTGFNMPIHNNDYCLGINSNIMTIKKDGTVYYVRIDYRVQGKDLRIFLDTVPEPVNLVLTINDLNLESLLMLSCGKSFVGFTSATGDDFQKHEILSWEFIPFVIEDNHIKPVISIEGKNPFCSGEKVTLRVKKKYPSILWSNGSNSQNIIVTEPGEYSVTVKDNTNCTGTATIKMDTLPSPKPKIKITGNYPPCKGDILILEPDKNYSSYLWNNSNNERNIIVNTSGIYTLRVTDSNGCAATTDLDLRFSDADKFYITTSPPPPHCNGDTCTLTLIGGYKSCKWSTGDTTRTTKVVTGGVYYAEIIDLNNCKISKIERVNYQNSQPVEIKIRGEYPICEGKFIRLEVQDEYQYYKWSNGERRYYINVNKSGSYFVEMLDTNGCLARGSIYLEFLNPYTPRIVNLSGNQLCNDEPVLLGTKEKYIAYLWSNGSTDEKISVNIPGEYIVKTVDENGCFGTSEPFILKKYQPPNITILGPETNCRNIISTYEAKEEFSGDYSYQWFCETDSIKSGAQSKSMSIYFNSTGSKTLTLIVYDKKTGCNKKIQREVSVTNEFSYKIEYPNSQICKDDSIILKGAPEFYSYKWNTGDTTNSVIVKQSGKYYFEAKLNGNCRIVSDTVSITVLPQLQPKITGRNFICSEQPVLLQTGVQYKTYLWSTGDTTDKCHIVNPGKYYVSVTDWNGCKGTDSIEISNFDDFFTQDTIEFGKIFVNENSFQFLEFKNKLNLPLTITNITFSGTNRDFTLFDLPVFPNYLLSDQSTTFSIGFIPSNQGKFLDSIMIYIDWPCIDTIKYYVTGEGIINSNDTIIIWIPDLVTNVNIPDFAVPLYAYSTYATEKKIEFKTRIEFDPYQFLPSGSSMNLLNNELTDKVRSVEVEGSALISTDTIKLGEIFGLTLLTNFEKTPIKISSFKATNDKSKLLIQNGSLIVSGVCGQILRLVQYYKEMSISLYPNPASDISNIIISNPIGKFFGFDVFLPDGRKQNVTWTEETNSNKSLIYRINTSQLSDGFYMLVLRGEQSSWALPLIVYR